MDKWHPLMATVETRPGFWRLVNPQGREYGRVELRKVNDGTEARYKAVCGGEVIGWASTLRLACERVHVAYVRSHGPQGGAKAYGDSSDS